MEYSPPPLFKQGASARAKVGFFSLIALVLLIADSRLHTLGMIRQLVGTGLYPLQVVALLPRDAVYMVGDYFSSLSSVQRENNKLKQEQVANAHTLQQVQQLAAENAQLRRLLDANERLPVKSIMSEILYDARDAFTRKVVLDRGSRHGVRPGQPVIDDVGVVGQVTRVFPFTSEITLLTDKDQAIPVQVVRTGLRSIAYGQGHSGALDLRFMPANADIKSGDMLITSGIDGIYPAGLAVAKVTQVESKSSDAFARINCLPVAGVDRNRQLLILLTESNFPERPAPEEARDKKDKASKKKALEAVKDVAKDAPKPAPAAHSATPATIAEPAAAKPAAAKPAAAKPAVAAPAAAASKPDATSTATSNKAAAATRPVAPARNNSNAQATTGTAPAPVPPATPTPAQVQKP
ncbi:rod shape-determining protein MreC [Noviherbaspirillum saxi]|uniref:Cell shape-determining protein MreC n=1 Tax=Noviherbaspirillum saxi TaxID=2320863 RepID=A0A3A3FTJ8_9BURK|nr:rod shape-determining protein MreC [Noviherbaspirillum saxi]RJF97511.1 rod shape-determining protein MreC [Noviherbaspirillum saxi]